jgi:hypothetical protein
MGSDGLANIREHLCRVLSLNLPARTFSP